MGSAGRQWQRFSYLTFSPLHIAGQRKLSRVPVYSDRRQCGILILGHNGASVFSDHDNNLKILHVAVKCNIIRCFASPEVPV
jgi:hypothetical protein